MHIDSYSKSLLDIFCDGFSSFWDSVSRKFSWKDKFNSWLNLSWWKSSSFVESDEFRSFSGNSVKSIMDERIHDVHSLLWDTNIWMNLFKNFVDIDGEGLDSSSSGFLVTFWFSLFLSHCKYLIYYFNCKFSWFKMSYYLQILMFKFWLDNLWIVLSVIFFFKTK